MDSEINAKVAELEKLLQDIELANSMRLWAKAEKLHAAWRAATKNALEDMYLNGYELGLELTRRVAAGKQG